MKTKIRTIIGMAALGIIGFTNINATADNKSLVNAEIVMEQEEMLTIESWMTEESYWAAEKVTIDTVAVEEALGVESWMTNEDLWK